MAQGSERCVLEMSHESGHRRNGEKETRKSCRVRKRRKEKVNEWRSNFKNVTSGLLTLTFCILTF